VPEAKSVKFLALTPSVDDLIADPFRPDADWVLRVPDAPGLGIERNREKVARDRPAA
jgi:L-alanine-DL-glutamate epimerase-like enolase superfamily enzyme